MVFCAFNFIVLLLYRGLVLVADGSATKATLSNWLFLHGFHFVDSSNNMFLCFFEETTFFCFLNAIEYNQIYEPYCFLAAAAFCTHPPSSS